MHHHLRPQHQASPARTHAEARHTFEELVHLTSVVKLSNEDAAWLYPEKALEETATHILDLGADLAVITKGSSGSLLATPSTSLSIPAVKTSVVDTIGAGDSYMSALILGLLTRGTGDLAPSVLDQLGLHSGCCGRDHRIPGRRPAPN